MHPTSLLISSGLAGSPSCMRCFLSTLSLLSSLDFPTNKVSASRSFFKWSNLFWVSSTKSCITGDLRSISVIVNNKINVDSVSVANSRNLQLDLMRSKRRGCKNEKQIFLHNVEGFILLLPFAICPNFFTVLFSFEATDFRKVTPVSAQERNGLRPFPKESVLLWPNIFFPM